MKKEKNETKEKTDEEIEILGLDKRLLLAKINQYKAVYPEELKKIKINTSWDIEKLKIILEEIQVIIQVNSVDEFALDTVFNVYV